MTLNESGKKRRSLRDSILGINLDRNSYGWFLRRCAYRVEGATMVGALFGSLCDDAEGTKNASQASWASSDTV